MKFNVYKHFAVVNYLVKLKEVNLAVQKLLNIFESPLTTN